MGYSIPVCVGRGWEMSRNSSTATAIVAAVPLKVGASWLAFSSPLGPIIDIGATPPGNYSYARRVSFIVSRKKLGNR